jgi:Flp pilus assembly protein TadG
VKPVIDRSVSGSKIRQKGVAAVELAILLPLFGILLLGVLEIGGMARDYQVIQNAAREGARFSALSKNETKGDTTIETRIKDRIITYLANERITVAASDITINQAYVIAVGTTNVTCSQITVSYSRPVTFKGIATWLPLGSTPLKGTSVFRNFY